MTKGRGKDGEIGYGRPPRTTRFKKGVSGNPSGRPKGAWSFSARLSKTLSEKVTINENGTRRRISKSEALMLQLVNKALNGDTKSTKLVLEIAGSLTELGRQAELEASYRGGNSSARERIFAKLDLMAERMRARAPRFPGDDAEVPEK